VRVLCVGTAFPPQGTGGYEQQCADAVGALRDAGHEVRVLTAEGPAEPGQEWVTRALPRFSAVPAAAVDPVAAAAGEARSAAVLAAELEAFAPAVVCLWRLGELSLSLVERVAAAGLPAVGVVCDGWMLDGPARDPWCRLQGRAPDFPALASWLVVSPWLRDRLAAAGIDLGDARPATPAPDPAVFAPRPAAPPWRGELLAPGRLSPLKGTEDAIRAVAQLPGARLTLLGSGDPAPWRALADGLGCGDRVRFDGPAPRPAVAAALARADAVLFAVRWDEPWGLVGLEALHVGVPVVATATGGSSAYLQDGRTCLRVPPAAPEAIAGAVGRLAASPALRAQLVAQGRAEAARWPAGAAPAAVVAAVEHAAAALSR
jgi:glycosyltransferase involved in cell wall biosynthesis